MALPPEPLDDLLPQATYGISATITEILHRDEQALVPNPDNPAVTDLPRELPAQRILLSITKTLFGPAPTGSVEVEKPAGSYILRAGIEGSFLLQVRGGDELPLVLGRYGPDTYSSTALNAALKAHKLT